jgi:hypothetical protein
MSTPATPATPEPDAKDWTWVIQQRCPDCGFDAAAIERDDVPDLTRQIAAILAHALQQPNVSARPEPTTWSALEYGCHVRDVCRLFAQRLHLMLTQDDPQFANWDQDETALADRYWAQRPAIVAAELRDAADAIADDFTEVGDDQWARPGTRSNGSVFTVDTFARYFLHDLAHHAWDVSSTRW